MKGTECKQILKSNKGQTAAEYVITVAALFMAFITFYIFYSHLVPQQFERGAKLILTVYETSNS